MTTREDARSLIGELLADPRRFVEDGRPYALLDAFWRGEPVETLRPLLRSGDPWVERAASFVAAELGAAAEVLVKDVISLLSSRDRLARNHAMEVLATCADGSQAEAFGHLAGMLEDDDIGIRLQAMDLVVGATTGQLHALAEFLRDHSEDRVAYANYVQMLINSGLSVAQIGSMLHSADALTRRYGAIAVKRLAQTDSGVAGLATDVEDPDLRDYLRGTSGGLNDQPP